MDMSKVPALILNPLEQLWQAIPGQTSTITDITNTTVFVTFPLELLGF